MNISLNWLSALLGRPLDADEIRDHLAMLGAPVEAVDRIGDELGAIVIGQVERVERHPNADRLSLCFVDNGSEIVEVVCGAPNVEAGKKYPYAPGGSTLPGGLVLKPRKIRGVLSNGMLCSPKELELGADHDGILELDTDAAPGAPFVEALGLADTLLDVEVTPNRPDLLCHKGVARDLGALLRVPVKLEPIPGAPKETLSPRRVERSGAVSGVDVSVEDVDGCPRYMAAVIKGVAIGPSPPWLQTRLRSIGQRPINNVVDATNYVLHELNQPLHAFDLDRLGGPAIVVRRARAGESLVTLDGEKRSLDPAMTMICDANGPTAIAGVMGGGDSELNEATTNVVLECAYFDPKRIRSTRSKLRMNTDASYRFERGMDIQGMAEALRRAVALIIATAGGTEADAPVDVYPKPVRSPTVFLRPERVAHLLGVKIPRADLEGYLTRLGFAVAPKADRIAVEPPGWRPDVTREVDLIEEIARLHGYESFDAEMQPFRPSTVPDDPMERQKARCRRVMTALGLHEARSLSLGPKGEEGAQAVLNPLSAEEVYLRTALMTGLVRSAERNWAVRERDVRLFEIGTVFSAREADLPVERLRIAGVVTGARRPPHWSDAQQSVDFDTWDVKCLFEEAARVGGPSGAIVSRGDRWVLEDSTGEVRGWAGVVDADRPPWAGELLGFEMDLVVQSGQVVQYQSLPETPPAERDLALLVPDDCRAADVEHIIKQFAGRHLESLTLFDEYRDRELTGRSLAWRLVFRAPDRTLRDKEVDAALTKVLRALEEQLGVQRR